MWVCGRRWPEPAGTPAASCCACCSATRASSSAALAAGSNAGSPVDRAPPAAADARRPRLRRHRCRRTWPGTTSSSWRCRTASRPPWPPQLPPTTPVVDLRRRLPADRRREAGTPTTAAPTPAPGPTGCPSCPVRVRDVAGAADGSPARAATRPRWRSASRRCSQPAWSSRRRRGRRRVGYVGRRPGAEAAPAGQRGHGSRVARTRPAASTSTRRRWSRASAAAAGTPVTLSFTPMLAPMPRGILATCTARLAPGADAAALRDALHAAYDDEPFVHAAAGRRRGRTTAATAGQQQRRISRSPPTRTPAGPSWSRPRQPVKGAAGQAVQNANLALGLDETAGLAASGIAP